MNERLQKKLDQMYLQAERAVASAETMRLRAAQAAITAAITAATERAKVQGAIELLGWSTYHFDGQNVVEGPQVSEEDGTAGERSA